MPSRRESIRDVFDLLADGLGRAQAKADIDKIVARAFRRIVDELCGYAGSLDGYDVTPDGIRRLGELAHERLPAEFRHFGAVLAARLFAENGDDIAGEEI